MTLVLILAATSGDVASAAAEFYLLAIVIGLVVALAMSLRMVSRNQPDHRSRDRSARAETAARDPVGRGCTLSRQPGAAPPLVLPAPRPESGRTQ